MNLLVLSIDGLHQGMIGAMGNGWIQTPNFDRLASQSIVFDRFYAESLHLPSIFDSLWSGPLPKRLEEFRTTLLTDDGDVFFHALAADFGARHRLDDPATDRPADSAEAAQFFKMLASTVDLLESGGKASHPLFLWTHLRGFRGVWDFPGEYRERHRGEEDPEPYGNTAPPNIDVRNAGAGIDPDELQAVMEAYAGGMSLLDDALAGLLDYLEEDGNTLLILLSTRGFSLGEHGSIGAGASIYGENVRLPLLIRFPDGFEAAARYSELLQTGDLAAFLGELPTGIEANPSRLAKTIREESTEPDRSLRIAGTGSEAAIVTPDWFLRRSGSDAYELYVKPDDRWETNDVADRCPEALEELLPLFDGTPVFFHKRLTEE